MNVQRQVSVILYRLKRNYPAAVTLRKATANHFDLETGRVTRPQEIVDIHRATVLPERRIPDYIYDLSFIAANKNFTYGGNFSSSTRLVLIDKKDIPKHFELALGDEVIFKNKIHALKVITDTADDRGYLLTVVSAGNINE